LATAIEAVTLVAAHSAAGEVQLVADTADRGRVEVTVNGDDAERDAEPQQRAIDP
jgi:hypothetical protein